MSATGCRNGHHGNIGTSAGQRPSVGFCRFQCRWAGVAGRRGCCLGIGYRLQQDTFYRLGQADVIISLNSAVGLIGSTTVVVVSSVLPPVVLSLVATPDDPTGAGFEADFADVVVVVTTLGVVNWACVFSTCCWYAS